MVARFSRTLVSTELDDSPVLGESPKCERALAEAVASHPRRGSTGSCHPTSQKEIYDEL